eukprot:SAG25_NODE_644_length_6218_cov_5.273901_4_plen_454_part_00
MTAALALRLGAMSFSTAALLVLLLSPCTGRGPLAEAALAATCPKAGWSVHTSFDATCERRRAKESTTKTCSECAAAAARANHSVYSWNQNSHHCYTTSCPSLFSGVPNGHVVSGCRPQLPGCGGVRPPTPPGPTPAPPAPPPGPAVFAPVAAGEFVMGRACPGCGSRRMDDPALALEPGYLSYDEQPPHKIAMRGFEMMKQTVSDHEFAESGLPGSAADVSHRVATEFAAWYTQRQHDGCEYRLPTEAEWEYARGHSSASLEFGPREHIFDWHGVYNDPPRAQPAAGPATGMLKVVRDGASASPTTRFAQSVDATSERGIAPATFRLVKVSQKWPGMGAQPARGPPPLPQVGVLSDGWAQTARGEVIDVSRLGPRATTAHFAVRAALPIPPDSELEGTASLAGLDPSILWHSHSPGMEVMPNGDVLAVWFTSSVGSHAGEVSRAFTHLGIGPY